MLGLGCMVVVVLGIGFFLCLASVDGNIFFAVILFIAAFGGALFADKIFAALGKLLFEKQEPLPISSSTSKPNITTETNSFVVHNQVANHGNTSVKDERLSEPEDVYLPGCVELNRDYARNQALVVYSGKADSNMRQSKYYENLYLVSKQTSQELTLTVCEAEGFAIADIPFKSLLACAFLYNGNVIRFCGEANLDYLGKNVHDDVSNDLGIDVSTADHDSKNENGTALELRIYTRYKEKSVISFKDKEFDKNDATKREAFEYLFEMVESALKMGGTELSVKNSSSGRGQKSTVHMQGDVADYEIAEKSDGYYIVKFNGFEKEEMIIPSLIDGKEIKGIAQYVFQGCVTVKNIRISEGIEVIENGAFKNCESVETVVLPDTLRQIGTMSQKYGNGAFEGASKLSSIIIPPNVEFLGLNSFKYCWALSNVELSNKITSIQRGAFRNCSNLLTIKLPNHLSKIEAEAFGYCTSLREVHIPVGTQAIENDAFKDTKLISVYIPSTVRNIGYHAFGYSTDHLTIYCEAGSAAMDYARKHRIKCAKAAF